MADLMDGAPERFSLMVWSINVRRQSTLAPVSLLGKAVDGSGTLWMVSPSLSTSSSSPEPRYARMTGVLAQQPK